MSKKITSNTTSKSNLLSKSGVWDYYREGDRSWYTHDPEWAKKLKNTLLAWALKESSLEIQQFVSEYRIPSTSYERALDKHPDLKEVHKEVMRILGARKKVGALTRKLSCEMVLKDLHVHLPEWHEINEYHKKLKEDEAISVAERLAAKPIIGDPYANLRKEEEEITKRIFEKVKAKLSEEEIAAMQAEAVKEYKAIKGE